MAAAVSFAGNVVKVVQDAEEEASNIVFVRFNGGFFRRAAALGQRSRWECLQGLSAPRLLSLLCTAVDCAVRALIRYTFYVVLAVHASGLVLVASQRHVQRVGAGVISYALPTAT